jgi:hypothetical protein
VQQVIDLEAIEQRMQQMTVSPLLSSLASQSEAYAERVKKALCQQVDS